MTLSIKFGSTHLHQIDVQIFVYDEIEAYHFEKVPSGEEN